jgi:hypothetical protein
MSFIFIFKSATLTYVTSCQYVIIERAVKECVGAEIFGVGDFWLETRVIIKNFVPSLLSKNLLLIFMWMKQEKKYFFGKKIPKWLTQKI